MKRTFFILALMITSVIVHAQFHKAKLVDEDKGLRGSSIRLGMELKEFPLLVPVYTNFWIGGTQLDGYRNPKENLIFGDVKLNEVRYYFTGDKLTTIHILFDRLDNEKVVKEFSKTYGLPTLVPLYPNSSTFGWRGEEIILSMPREAPLLAEFYYEKLSRKDVYDKSDKEMYEELLKEPFKYCENCSDRSEKQQLKVNKKQIKYFKQSRKVGIKQYKKNLKDYKDSKYFKEYSESKAEFNSQGQD